jgi:hypothetical protein
MHGEVDLALEDKLKKLCPIYRSQGSCRHLCEERCYYLQYEPKRKMAELLIKVRDSGEGMDSWINGWKACISPRHSKQNQEASRWTFSFMSPEGRRFSSIDSVLKSIKGSPLEEIHGPVSCQVLSEAHTHLTLITHCTKPWLACKPLRSSWQRMCCPTTTSLMLPYNSYHDGCIFD